MFAPACGRLYILISDNAICTVQSALSLAAAKAGAVCTSKADTIYATVMQKAPVVAIDVLHSSLFFLLQDGDRSCADYCTNVGLVMPPVLFWQAFAATCGHCDM